MIEHEVEIDTNKKYSMPEHIVEKNVNGKFLIISVESGNWIVLNNDIQLRIFEYLKDKSIVDTINFVEVNHLPEEDLMKVLTELEAKCFEDTSVSLSEKNGLCIYLTNKCNLRCKHCYMYAGERSNEELQTDEVINILNEFKKFGGKAVTFTGGEITERADLVEILKCAKGLGFTITILTNGTMWDESLVEGIYRSIDEIQISIDGYDEKSNAKVRGEGFFNQSLETIEEFIQRNVKVALNVTPLLDDLKKDKDKYTKFGQAMIDKYQGKDFIIRFNFELLQGRNININPEQNKEYSKIMNEIVEICYPGSKKVEFVLNHEDNTILDNCGYGGITISATGDIFFCNRVYEVNKYCNIRNTSFERIMELSRKAMSLSNINNLQPCCNCDIKYICGGGCRITYFNDLVKVDSLDNLNLTNGLRTRTCDNDHKYKFYKLMIDTNEKFYR